MICFIQGAMSGLLLGLAFSLWIGFGGPKPPTPRLSQNTDECSFVNTTLDYTSELMAASTDIPTAASTTETYYFPLYRLSYMWYAPLGFLITILIAQLVSRSVVKFRRNRGHLPPTINEALLSPLFPRCFRNTEQLQDPILLVLL